MSLPPRPASADRVPPLRRMWRSAAAVVPYAALVAGLTTEAVDASTTVEAFGLTVVVVALARIAFVIPWLVDRDPADRERSNGL